MGRLIGMSGAFIPTAKSLGAEFFLSAADHAEGWGLSGYNGHRAVYFGRSEQSVSEDKEAYLKSLERAASSATPVLVGHFRHAPDGHRDIGSVHPFHHRDWVFAQDGSFSRWGDLVLSDVPPQGQTDSERFFHWLMDRVYSSENPHQSLEAALAEFKDRFDYTSLTFILTNGKTTWAYCESRKARSPLFLQKNKTGFLICSQRLGTASLWTAFEEKKLVQIEVA